MGQNINIDVHHITRVEGHGNIVVNVNDGVVERCEWQVPEAPRFFEAMVRGRHYSEVARIVSRICGICSIGHTLASVKATEAALGIEVTPQTSKLRTLLKHAENFDSHVLHVYVLVAPDLLGAPSAFALVPTHGEVVARALRLKRLAHEWGSLIGGRTTHPTTVLPGGFSKVPTVAELAAMRDKLAAAVPDLEATLETIAALAPVIPAFDRPTEYMAVSSDEEYGLYDGYVQTILRRRRARALRGRRLPQLHQRVRLAAVHGEVHQEPPRQLRGRRARALQRQLRPAAPGGQEGRRVARHEPRCARTRTSTPWPRSSRSCTPPTRGCACSTS